VRALSPLFKQGTTQSRTHSPSAGFINKEWTWLKGKSTAALHTKAAVFDYIFTTGSGKNSATFYQSVVYLEPANLNLPYFSLRPEGIMSKVYSAFGYQDIDFGQRPEFSRQYLLRGQDEQAIRRTFNDGLLSFYESYPGTCTDGGGNQLFIYRGGYRLQPQEIRPYVGLGLEVLNLLPRY